MNRDTTITAIDTKSWFPVQTSGLAAPHLKIQYHDPRVFEVLQAAFGDLFPAITLDEETGEFSYEQKSERGRDLLLDGVPVESMSDIPKTEVMRLMEGWIKLRRRMQEERIPADLKPVMLNFHIPNPSDSPDRYLLCKRGERTRLVILWGFEQKATPAISIERAIAKLMDVSLVQMRSILSTTLPANTGTVPVRAFVEEAEKKINKARRERQGGISPKVLIGAAAAVLVLVGVAVAALNGGKDEPKTVEKIVIREQVVVPPVAPAQQSVVEPVLAKPVAVQQVPASQTPKVEQKQASVNTLDMMADFSKSKPHDAQQSLMEQMTGSSTQGSNQMPNLNGMLPSAQQ